MLIIIKLISIAIIGYLLGSINTSIIVGKVHGVNIKQHGSGNAGMTNAIRVMGKSAGVFVILGDVLKGIISCTIGYYLLKESNMYSIAIMLGGLAAIIGHIWPLYFSFKGGKGVLTSLSVVLFVDWKMALILLVVFIIIVLSTKYVSLGSIIATLMFPTLAIILGKDNYYLSFSCIIAILAVVMHRKNIERLIEGTEPKITLKKKVKN